MAGGSIALGLFELYAPGPAFPEYRVSDQAKELLGSSTDTSQMESQFATTRDAADVEKDPPPTRGGHFRLSLMPLVDWLHISRVLELQSSARPATETTLGHLSG
jgi:hypothetical protein